MPAAKKKTAKTREKIWPFTPKEVTTIKKPILKKLRFILFFLLPVLANAQEGELPDERIIIQKDKKIVLPEVAKPAEKVTQTLKPLPKIKQKYSYKEFTISLPLIEPKLSAPVLKPEPELGVKQGYLRIGAGNYGTTLFDGYFNSGRKKDYSFGLYAKHLASANGPVKHSGFSNNELGANAKYFTNAFNLSGGLAFNRDRYNFYGFDRELSPNRGQDSTKQVLQSIWFQLNLERIKKNSPLTYNLGLGVGNISDRFKASESEVSIDFNGKYKIKDSSGIKLFSDITLAKRADNSNQNRSLIRFQPQYHFVWKGFQFDAGFQLASANEPELKANSTKGSNKNSIHFFPQLRVEQLLVKNSLSIFAGLGGGMQKRTLRTNLNINPFLAPDVDLRFENQRYSLFLGLKGTSFGKFSYQSKILFENLKNQAFMVNEPGIQERFVLVYDSGNTRRFTFETDAVYDLSQITKLGLRVSFFSYGLKTLEKPWHAPGSLISVFGRQWLNENLVLSSEFYYMGGIRALDPETTETESLKALADLNLKGEYFFKKLYSGFISVHNLLNNKNEPFLYYPTQGFRLMLGASASF